MIDVAELFPPVDWQRPWYPAGLVGHIYADCERLLRVVPEPREGCGWLNPLDRHVCGDCLTRYGIAGWDAECRTCDAVMSDEEDNETPITEKDARNWSQEHQCDPDVWVSGPRDQKKAAPGPRKPAPLRRL
jgi:hypothetical protein